MATTKPTQASAAQTQQPQPGVQPKEKPSRFLSWVLWFVAIVTLVGYAMGEIPLGWMIGIIIAAIAVEIFTGLKNSA